MSAPKTVGAFEAAIEAHLLEHGGWLEGDASAFDAKLAITPGDFFAFVEATQADLWAQLTKAHGDSLRDSVLDHLTRAMDTRGSLDVIRHGFKFYGKKIRCAYFQPAHALNDETLAQYRRNRLVVTRQVNFSPDTQQSIDMLLSFNGIPVATVELKNHLTGQSFRNSIHQYKTDRDPKVKLFAFKKRALVHFALDAEVAFMTTRLARAKTRFLPFNRGASGGAGNPQHPSGHRTAYLWQDVWQFDSLTVWRATRGSSAATSTTPSSRRCCSGCSLGAFTTSSAQSNGGAGSQLRPLASSQNACIRLTTR